MKNILTFIFGILISCALWAQPTIKVNEFASGFDRPVDIAYTKDGRLFVIEQKGVIKIIRANGDVVAGSFLDITDRVRSGGERGLLGVTFHPNYSSNGYFYVNYTDSEGATTLSRFSVSSNQNKANKSSEKVLLVVPQPFSNHNGGCLKFGPDGYLYFGIGDGGDGGDPQNNAQDNTSLLGKMLRIDVDKGNPYSIPAGNPFVGNAGFPDEIFSTGFRNPWRFSFDRQTGDLWIGDVGQGSFEEVNFVRSGSGSGLDFGWRCYEGFQEFNTDGCAARSTYTFPAYAYPTSESVGQSVTGGFVYRGSKYSDIKGHYIYGDFVSGRIWSLTPNGNGDFSNVELMDFQNGQISSFGENVAGELFMAALGEGKIYRIEGSVLATDNDGNNGNDGDDNDGNNGNGGDDNDGNDDSSCSTPTNIKIDAQRLRITQISWDAAPNARFYNLEIRVKGSARPIVKARTDGTRIGYYGRINSTYEFRVKSSCSSGVTSTFSEWQEFKINFRYAVNGNSRNRDSHFGEYDTIIELPTTMKLFPNPAFDWVNVEYLIFSKEARLNVYHISGKQVKSILLNPSVIQHQVDLSDLANGMYFFSIMEDGQSMVTEKVFKQN